MWMNDLINNKLSIDWFFSDHLLPPAWRWWGLFNVLTFYKILDIASPPFIPPHLILPLLIPHLLSRSLYLWQNCCHYHVQTLSRNLVLFSSARTLPSDKSIPLAEMLLQRKCIMSFSLMLSAASIRMRFIWRCSEPWKRINILFSYKYFNLIKLKRKPEG